MGSFVTTFAGVFVALLWVLVLGRMLVSWFDPTGQGAVSRFLIQMTEPILGPVRRLLPRTGMIDLSGLLVLLVLGALWRALLR